MTDTHDDRRIAPRLRPALGTTCRFDPATDSPAPPLGLVWNISRTGVSMLTVFQPEPGQLLSGELVADGTASLAVLLRVVHVKSVPTGDYMIGAQFLRELTPGELVPFVEPHAKPGLR